MVEVLKFVCELSSDATRAVFSHLRIIGEKEGLTTDNISVDDLSKDQREFISISFDCLLCCRASDREAVLPFYLDSIGRIVVLNEKQIRIAAREHLLKSTSNFPNYVFFDYDEYIYTDHEFDDDIFSIMIDLNTAVVSCSDKIRTVKKYADVFLAYSFLKKEGQQMFFYLSAIYDVLPTELLTELTSTPVSPPQKPDDDLSKNQDNGRALDFTENVPKQTRPHCLSFLTEIRIEDLTSWELMVVNNVLPFVSPRNVDIYGCRDVQLIESMVSKLQFTDNLHSLKLNEINLTAKCATDIARSLHQAPNLHKLDLSYNPLHSGVSDLAENLHRVPRLTELKLYDDVNMGDKESKTLAHSLKHVNKLQVMDLSFNPLGHGIIELAKLDLCSVPHLTELRLCDTQMGEEEVSALARALKYVPELEWLNLESNPLGRGVSDLTQHLSSIPKLRHLYLNRVKMTKKEAEELCSAVRGNNIWLRTDYHTRDRYTRDYRLCTEAELKEQSQRWREPIVFADE